MADNVNQRVEDECEFFEVFVEFYTKDKLNIKFYKNFKEFTNNIILDKVY